MDGEGAQSPRGRRLAWGLVGLALTGSLAWWVLGPGHRLPDPGVPDPFEAIGPDPGGFATPDPNWRADLPADHGAHPAYRGESWVLSGHLVEPGGRIHDFQFSLARLALSPQPTQRGSAWAANQLYRAQLDLRPTGGADPRRGERLSRAALDLAGSAPDPPRVWVRGWDLTVDGSDLTLIAQAEDATLDLRLQPMKPPVDGADLDLPLGGDESGLNLYLLPRLRISGRLGLAGENRPVSGLALLDHAWGAIPGGSGQIAFNRFRLQLDDGRDLLCLRLARRDGSGTPIPGCALVDADGNVRSFGRREIDLDPLDSWRSPATGQVYPLTWSLGLPPLDLRLRLTPVAEDQELDLPIRLWSGAVTVSGIQSGTPLTGRGRIEVGPGSGTQPR